MWRKTGSVFNKSKLCWNFSSHQPCRLFCYLTLWLSPHSLESCFDLSMSYAVGADDHVSTPSLSASVESLWVMLAMWDIRPRSHCRANTPSCRSRDVHWYHCKKQRRRRMCEKWKSCRKFPLRRNPLTGPCFHRNRVACGAHERLVLKLLKAFVDLNLRYTTLLLSTTSVEMSYIESCLIYEFKVVRRDHHHAGHKTNNHVNVARLKYTSAIICSWRSLNCALANLLLSSSRFFFFTLIFLSLRCVFRFPPHFGCLWRVSRSHLIWDVVVTTTHIWRSCALSWLLFYNHNLFG